MITIQPIAVGNILRTQTKRVSCVMSDDTRVHADTLTKTKGEDGAIYTTRADLKQET